MLRSLPAARPVCAKAVSISRAPSWRCLGSKRARSMAAVSCSARPRESGDPGLRLARILDSRLRGNERRKDSGRATIAILGLLAILAMTASAAHAQRTAPKIWDIKLGTPVAALPTNDFVDPACGTNGGPPARVLRSF